MLLDLLKLIFHLHYDALHIGVIALRAEGVDFAPHLLRDKPEFLALTRRGRLQGLDKVSEMLGETLLFFVDVEFLSIEYHLFLLTSLVNLNAVNVLCALFNPGPDC